MKSLTRRLDASVTTTTCTDHFLRKFLVTRKKRLTSKNGPTTSQTPFAGSLFRCFLVERRQVFSIAAIFEMLSSSEARVRGVEPVLHPSLGKDSPS